MAMKPRPTYSKCVVIHKHHTVITYYANGKKRYIVEPIMKEKNNGKCKV